jgi:hypothetical protein
MSSLERNEMRERNSVSSEEKFEIWLAENKVRLSKLANPHLAIFQRSGEISCIDDPDELASKIEHHLSNLEWMISRFYRGLYKPLTSEGKQIYGNERFRMKSVRCFHLDVKTRLEPCLKRDDIYTNLGQLRFEFYNREKAFHNKLHDIDTSHARNQDRWPLYLVELDEAKIFLGRLISEIRRIL